jgi:uncharacterized protein YbjQ (UPF0145 family)
MKASFFGLAAALLALSGCSQFTFSRYLMANPLPPYTGVVRAVAVGQLVPGSFDEIAILQTQRFSDGDVRHVTAKLASEAAAIGCDTIINFRVNSGMRWALYGHVMWTSASGTCVRMHPQPGAPASPPGAP